MSGLDSSDAELWVCDTCGFEGMFRLAWGLTTLDLETDTYYIPCPFHATNEGGKMREESSS
jgi:hypothetical protein